MTHTQEAFESHVKHGTECWAMGCDEPQNGSGYCVNHDPDQPPHCENPWCQHRETNWHRCVYCGESHMDDRCH